MRALSRRRTLLWSGGLISGLGLLILPLLAARKDYQNPLKLAARALDRNAQDRKHGFGGRHPREVRGTDLSLALEDVLESPVVGPCGVVEP